MRRLSVPGVVGAAVSWVFAWLPSLLPSGTLLHGIALGATAAAGYAIGVVLASAVKAAHRAARRDRPPANTPAARWQRTGAAIASLVVFAALACGAWLSGDLNRQADSLGTPQYTVAWAQASVIGLAVFAVVLLAARGVGAGSRLLARLLPHQWAPVARVAVSGLATAGCVALLAAFAVMGLRIAFDNIDADEAGQSAPTSPSRSGSDESLVTFDSLGRQGRAFVTEGSSIQTIRAYAGLASAPDATERAELAVQDMLRAGGAQAPVWIGITTTGNGYVDPAAADAADAATQGRAALVAMQYSTLPSWLSFLVDQESAKEAGTALYWALAQAREQLPADDRPKLILYGESLGAFGSAAPFAGLSAEETAQRIDGALWVGPPAATQPVADWTYAGAPPVWQPVLDGGRRVRYAASPGAAEDPPGDGPWLVPRILVLQNPTDPVVWLTPSLAWQPAPWLDAPRGPGVQSGTRWLPVLFGLQVALDLPQAVAMPSGVGHDYTTALLAAWQQVLAAQG